MAPNRRGGANPASGRTRPPFPARGFLQPAPPLGLPGRPRPPFGPGLEAAAAATTATPRLCRVLDPRSGRGAVSACVARAPEAFVCGPCLLQRGWSGQCGVPRAPSQGAPTPAPFPVPGCPPRREHPELGRLLRLPGPDQLGETGIQPRPQLCLPLPRAQGAGALCDLPSPRTPWRRLRVWS